MILQANDLHFVFSRSQRSLKAFDMAGTLRFGCEARNDTVNEGYGHFGHCPPGEFVLGVPVWKEEVPFGNWFIPLSDYGDHHTMRQYGRAGIGVHGGGSGLAHPFAGIQGWVITEGCIRLQNLSLTQLVTLVQDRQAKGGICYLTVSE
jgi:hypothetical protein